MGEVRDITIVGSGPAGYTAAIYAARTNLRPLVLAGARPGGQLLITTMVENFPGFAEGVQGPELMQIMRRQAERFGTEVVQAEVREVDLRTWPFKLWAGGREYASRAVIVATGALARWLGVPGEARLRGRGVSACATCDGFLFADEAIAVVGGGDTALEEATYLTRFASSVTVIHRRDQLRASAALQKRALANEKIKFLWHSAVIEALGEEMLEAVRLRDVRTGEDSVVPFGGLFVAIGHQPNTAVFRGQIDLDDDGYVRVPNPASTATNIPGVFAAGDVRDPTYRQAITAAGDGCRAALDAERWLQAHSAHQV